MRHIPVCGPAGGQTEPVPFLGKVEARKCPSFDFFPSILGKKGSTDPEQFFDLIQPLPSPHDAIAIDAKDKDVRHPLVLFHYLLDALGFQRLAHTAKQGVLTDADASPSVADMSEEA